MGNALKEQGKLDEAIEAYTKALSIKPDFAEVQSNIGAVWQSRDQPKQAIKAYKRAISIKPDYGPAYYNLGLVFQERGKIEEAVEAYNKAILIKPDYDEVHRTLSTIKKYTVNDPHFIQVKKLYNGQGHSEEIRCNLNFALAKMYEDIGEINMAFDHLMKGNSLRKKLLNYSIDQDKIFFAQLKKSQPAIFENSLERERCFKGPRPIFILGMPRSGTTLVEQIISSHSQVTGAGELNQVKRHSLALAIGETTLSKENISEFREKYLLKLNKLSKGNQFVTDKMPQNFRFIPLICAALPEAKIIHVQRNAAATCWSNYKQYFSKKGLGYSYNLRDVVAYYYLYIGLMKFWQSNYGKKIYNLNYEKLTTDQENETRKLIDYLDLNWEETCLSPQKNKRSVRTASQQQVRQKIYKGSSEAWRKYEPHLNGVFDGLASG